EGGDQRGRHEVTRAQAAGMTAKHLGLGDAVVPVLPGERWKRVPAVVGAANLGGKDDASTGVSNSVVELVVLASIDVLGKVPHALEDAATVCPVGHGVRFL